MSWFEGVQLKCRPQVGTLLLIAPSELESPDGVSNSRHLSPEILFVKMKTRIAAEFSMVAPVILPILSHNLLHASEVPSGFFHIPLFSYLGQSVVTGCRLTRSH